MARAVVRYSFDKQVANKSGNKVGDGLEAGGFQSIGTCAYEITGKSIAEITAALRAMLDIMDNPPSGALDHVWIYLDKK